MNRLLDMVDSKLLERQSDSVGVWLEASADVIGNLGFEPFVKLYRSEPFHWCAYE